MRFDELILRRYGHFTDFTLSFPKPNIKAASSADGEYNGLDFHIFYGPNEAGKSTTLSAITDLLYGIDRQTPYNFVHSYDLLEIEATLAQDNNSIGVKRFKNRLTNLEGDRLDSLPLDLQGLSRDDYRSRFSFNEFTLQEGGNDMLDSKGDVGEALFSASSGISNLSSRLDSVMKQADSFWIPGRKSKIELVELKKRLNETKLDSLSQAQEQVDKAAEKRNSISLSLKQLETEKSLFSLATRWMAEKASLLHIESMGVLKEDSLGIFDLSSETSTQAALKQLRTDIQNSTLATAKKNDILRDIENTQKQIVLSELSRADTELLSSRADIEKFVESASAATEWQSQLNEHLNVIEQCDSRIRILSAELKIDPQEAERLNLDLEDQSQSSAIATLESLEIINDFLQRVRSEQLVNHLSIAREAEEKKRQELKSSAMEFGLNVSDLNTVQLPDEQWLLDALESWKLTKDKIKQIDERIKLFNVELSDNERQISALQSTDISDPDLLLSSSKSRDELWRTHREAIAKGVVHTELDSSAQQFEQEMLSVDRATSLALDQKDQHAKLRLLRDQELQLQKDIEALAISKTSLESELSGYKEILKEGIGSFYTLPSIHQESIRNRFNSARALQKLAHSVAEQSQVTETTHNQGLAQCKQLFDILAPLSDPALLDQLGTMELKDLTQYAEKFVKREHERNMASRILIDIFSITRCQ